MSQHVPASEFEEAAKTNGASAVSLAKTDNEEEPKGGYSRESHASHPGVSVVKRGKIFYLKWRTDFAKGQYRYRWERLDSKNRRAAEGEAKRKSEELGASKKNWMSQRATALYRLPVQEGLSAYLEHLRGERRERDERFVRRAVAGAEQYLDRFTEFLVQRNIQRCERLTSDDLQEFRKILGGAKLKVLDPDTQAYKEGSKPLSNVSINRILDGVRSALRWMVKRRYLFIGRDEIGEALSHYPVTRASEPRILNSVELLRLLKKLREHDLARFKSSRNDKNAYHQKRQSKSARPRFRPLAPFVVVSLLTGARPGEVENLTGSDVRLEYQTIALRDTKRGRMRVLPLHDSPILNELVSGLVQRAGNNPIIGRVKLKHIVELGSKAGIADLSRQVLRRTCVAHVASGSTDSEYLLTSRFGHSTDVSVAHYRQALHGVRERGNTVEAWLGIESELRLVLTDLGYLRPQSKKTDSGKRKHGRGRSASG
ncbi:MAG: hypothetical protein KBG84_11010, partial [Planctomycetes bacterium]|nr:hypothetical protein [Planctomycetota bacterium]